MGCVHPHINLGKHVVFGRVIRGFDDVVLKVAQVATDEKDRPTVPVIIINCGELELRKKPAAPREYFFFFLAKEKGNPHAYQIFFGSERTLGERKRI